VLGILVADGRVDDEAVGDGLDDGVEADLNVKPCIANTTPPPTKTIATTRMTMNFMLMTLRFMFVF
jgi:hypothetical protein